MYELSQAFYFEAAHTLQRRSEREASLRIHGHTYHAEVTVSGVPEPETGMVLDLAILRREITRVREELDHRFLDEVHELGPPTLENLCGFIHRMLVPALNNVVSIVVERKASGDRCVLRLPLKARAPISESHQTTRTERQLLAVD